MNQPSDVPLMDMSTYDEHATGGMDCVPAGLYPCYLYNHEFKHYDDGRLGLKLKFLIAEGEYADKKPLINFNIRNPSPEAVRISGERLKKLTIACGIDGNTMLTEALINQFYEKLFIVEFSVNKSTNPKYPNDSNEVRQIWHPDNIPQDSSPAAASAPATPPAQAAQPPAKPPATPPANTSPPPASAPNPAQAAAGGQPSDVAQWEGGNSTAPPKPPPAQAPSAPPASPPQ